MPLQSVSKKCCNRSILSIGLHQPDIWAVISATAEYRLWNRRVDTPFTSMVIRENSEGGLRASDFADLSPKFHRKLRLRRTRRRTSRDESSLYNPKPLS